MQLRVENGMKASNHQVHGKRAGGETVGVVLHVGGEPGASVVRPLGRLSWTVDQAEGGEGRVQRLARFAGAKRTELAVLGSTAVVASLGRTVQRVTCLASVRPVAPRLVVTSSQGFSPGPVARGNTRLEVDEGGIYSW